MRKLLGLAALLIFSACFAGISGAEEMKPSYEKAAFAAGCFWGVEKVFSETDGVVATQVGYTGGTTKNPTYQQVCTGTTGHAEAIEITYDPSRISYKKLLEIFFSTHDPTTMNHQGPDVGTQYRSAIFTTSPTQREAASKAREFLDLSGIFKSKIVTQIEPAGEFYHAEEYHQKYLKKNPHGYCSIQFQSKKIGEILREGLKP